MINLAKYRVPVFFSIFILVLAGTFAAVKFAQGYRLDLTNKRLKPTGLLVVTSTPKGAQVFINGELKTATDNTLALEPGEYQVEIKKNGFTPWQKKLLIEKELVTSADAYLFPLVPDLKPLTVNGAVNPQISPDGTKIVYGVAPAASKSAALTEEAGLWVMDLADFLFFNRAPRQIAVNKLHDFSSATYSWSYDSRQILVEFKTGEKYLLDPNQLNPSPVNVAASLKDIYQVWENEEKAQEEAKLKKVPEALRQILAEKAAQIEFSPDNTKILYVATASATIPEKLIPPVLAASSQPEERNLQAGKMYVYDLKEDKNFLIPYDGQISLPTPTPTLAKKRPQPTPTPPPSLSNSETENSRIPAVQWFPTSRHLFWISGNKVLICEYDGTNLTPIYTGPFVKPYVFAAPNANRLIVLTNLSAEEKPNLYSVSLK